MLFFVAVGNGYKDMRGLARLTQATRNSIAGLRDGWGERAFRLEVFIAAVLLPVAAWVPVAPVERAVLVVSVLIVLVAELLNSAVEAAIDRISSERHELSRRAKDLGSAAVMVALFACLLAWAAILMPVYLRG